MCGNVGLPKILKDRVERKLLRAIQMLRRNSMNFTVKDIVYKSGLNPSTAKRRTISHYLSRLGYHHFQARKKGLLNNKNKIIWTKYARHAKKTTARLSGFLHMYRFTWMISLLFISTTH